MRLIMAINPPVLIGLIIIAPALIPAFLGPGWETSIPVVQALSLLVLLRSPGSINFGLNP